MQSMRDTYLRLGVRQQNWLRLEQLRRVRTAKRLLWRALLRSLLRDSGLTTRSRLWAKRRWVVTAATSMVTKHNTRCRFSGRTRQAFRDLQLARMQFRQLFAEGRLAQYRLGRF